MENEMQEQESKSSPPVAAKALNWREQRVLKALGTRRMTPWHIRDLTRKCFPGVRPVTKGDSQVRNALRRLVRDGRVRYVGTPSNPGRYELA